MIGWRCCYYHMYRCVTWAVIVCCLATYLWWRVLVAWLPLATRLLYTVCSAPGTWLMSAMLRWDIRNNSALRETIDLIMCLISFLVFARITCTQFIDVGYCYRCLAVTWSICLSVCLSLSLCLCVCVCQSCKHGWTNWDAGWEHNRVNPKNHVLDGVHVGTTWQMQLNVQKWRHFWLSLQSLLVGRQE